MSADLPISGEVGPSDVPQFNPEGSMLASYLMVSGPWKLMTWTNTDIAMSTATPFSRRTGRVGLVANRLGLIGLRPGPISVQPITSCCRGWRLVLPRQQRKPHEFRAVRCNQLLFTIQSMLQDSAPTSSVDGQLGTL